ncbi:hypothetical protein JW707_02070 [Candidatus Woesearchaeota archaeon]|nr:hypothetical protein [Candidatus Woesearchaeota archaeon]
MKRSEQSMAGWYFLLIVIAICIVVFIAKPSAMMPSLSFFAGIIKKIIPVFILIFALLVIMNWLVKPEKIVKHLGKDAGAKGWFYSIIGGIISTGPIYMWYPLLSELQKHKARNGYVAAFLYNRAVKPALLPLFIYYFGLVYAVVLTIVMIIASVFQGIIVEKIMEVKK